MLHRHEFDDLAEAHQIRLAEGLIRQELVQLLPRSRASDQNSARRRNARAAQQETALIVSGLKKLAVRGNQIWIPLLERDEVFAFKEEIFHPALLQQSCG